MMIKIKCYLTCSDDVVRVVISTELARQQTHPILLLHQLVRVQDLEGVLINDQQRINLKK